MVAASTAATAVVATGRVAGGSRCTVPALRGRLFIPWICIFRSQPAPPRAAPHEPLLCYPLSVPLIAHTRSPVLTVSWGGCAIDGVHAYMHGHGSTVNSVYERLSGV